jgi:AcrR family transcriptional regulator
MTRGADLTSQPRALRSRQTILEAAGAEFIERRFAAATLKGVASRAGLATGAVMFHFPSKEALASDLIRLEEALAQTLRDRHTAATRLPSQPLIVTDLHGLLREWAALISSSPIVGGAISLIVERPEFVTDKYESWGLWIEKIETMLVAAAEQGELREGIEPSEWAEYIAESFTGTQLVSAAASQHQDFLERFDRAWRITAPALVSTSQLTRFRAETVATQGGSESSLRGRSWFDSGAVITSLVTAPGRHSRSTDAVHPRHVSGR